MKFPVVLHSDDGQRYGVSVPDLAGCFSAGDNIDDALESVKEAIELHLEGLLADGEELPVIAPISQHASFPSSSLGMPTLKLCLMFNRYEYKDKPVLFVDTPSGAWQ